MSSVLLYELNKTLGIFLSTWDRGCQNPQMKGEAMNFRHTFQHIRAFSSNFLTRFKLNSFRGIDLVFSNSGIKRLKYASQIHLFWKRRMWMVSIKAIRSVSWKVFLESSLGLFTKGIGAMSVEEFVHHSYVHSRHV